MGRFGVNVPVNDDWDHIETTVRWLQNGVDMRTVFAPYNEHCIAVTRLLTYALLTCSGGNFHVVLMANALFMVAVIALLLAFVRRWPLDTWYMALFTVAIAVLLTAWCQWQILLWASAIPWSFLPLLTVLAAVLIVRTRSPWMAVFVAGIAAMAGIVCNSNGLFVGWSLVPAIILRMRGELRSRVLLPSLIFALLLLTSTAIGAWLIARGHGARGGGLMAVLAAPGESLRCVLAILGRPLDPVGAINGNQVMAAVLGAISLVVGSTACVVGMRHGSSMPRREFGPGFALMGYGLASVMAVVFGRLGNITAGPIESRYQAFAIAWHAGVLLTLALLSTGPAAGRRPATWRLVLTFASWICIATTLIVMPIFLAHGRNMRCALMEHQAIYREAGLPGGRQRLEKISRHFGADRLIKDMEAMRLRHILHSDLSPVREGR